MGRVGCHAALLQLLIEEQAQEERQGSRRSVSEDTSCEGKGGWMMIRSDPTYCMLT